MNLLTERAKVRRTLLNNRALSCLDMYESGMTLKEVGRVSGGVGRERARQLVARGIRLRCSKLYCGIDDPSERAAKTREEFVRVRTLSYANRRIAK